MSHDPDTHDGGGHGHGFTGPSPLSRTAARVVIALLTAVGLAVVVGAVLLWPQQRDFEIPAPLQDGVGGAVSTVAATVSTAEPGSCTEPSGRLVDAPAPAPPLDADCSRLVIAVIDGPDAGRAVQLVVPPDPGYPSLVAGDEVRLSRSIGPEGAPLYNFYDYSRGLPLALFAIAFAVAVVAVARWRGLRALIGLGLAFAVVVGFVVPALLGGRPALPVALVGGAAILFAVIFLAHGVTLRTSAALLGTLAALGLSAGLAQLSVALTRVTGLSDENTNDVAVYLGGVDLRGLLLAGFVIGSLGVLNDVTITQASAAFELAALDPGRSATQVYAATMRVGRDHIASTVYTLVLAYAGAALPLLLLFSVSGRSLRDVLSGDEVSVEIVRALVGGIALVLAVPLTTAIAVALARPGHVRPATTRHRR